MVRQTGQKFNARKKRTRSNQIVSRLSYCPTKDKGRYTGKLRAQLQAKELPSPASTVPISTIEIGAININGMDMESSWALEQIVSKYNLQVLDYYSSTNTIIITLLKVLGVSETHGRADMAQDPIEIANFHSWRTERSGQDKGGGGLCLYYHDSLTAHCWSPNVPPQFAYVQNERQWLLFDGSANKFAFLHVYIACQTNQNTNYIEWNEDLFNLLSQETLRLRREGFSVLALGDFNTRVGDIPGLEANHPGTNNNTPMFLNFISQTNLLIINTLPVSKGLFTRFMGDSGTKGVLLDYGLIDNEHSNNVTSFVIDEQARYSCGSDHALLVASLVFSTRPVVKWNHEEVVRYDFSHGSSYLDFQSHLDKVSSEVPLSTFQDLTTDEMLPHLTKSLNESGMKAFGIKILFMYT